MGVDNAGSKGEKSGDATMRSQSSEYGRSFDALGLTGKFVRCYESHPPLPLKDGLIIYGGSCSTPIIHDADVYVGFDFSMKKSSMSYPWVPGESFLFPIQDMGVPHDLAQFKKLVEWLEVQLIAKKKVHVGCIGGHGRTGLVLSVLVHNMLDMPDSTLYVREKYCEKAVESVAQVDWLFQHFGIKKVAPRKEHGLSKDFARPVAQAPAAICFPKPPVKETYQFKSDTKKGPVQAKAKQMSIWGNGSPFKGG